MRTKNTIIFSLISTFFLIFLISIWKILATLQGLNINSFDGKGNFSMGIKEHIIFPEINFDKVEKVRGMDITICTSAKNNDEAIQLLKSFNMPFIDKQVN